MGRTGPEGCDHSRQQLLEDLSSANKIRFIFKGSLCVCQIEVGGRKVSGER